MKEFLSDIGFATVACGCMIGVYLSLYAIKEGVKKLKYHYKVKHRFNKPPTAKCYCRDCRFHGADGIYNGTSESGYEKYLLPFKMTRPPQSWCYVEEISNATF